MVVGFSRIQECNENIRGQIASVLIEKPLGRTDLSGCAVPYVRCADGCYVPINKYLKRMRVGEVSSAEHYQEQLEHELG